MPIYCSNLKAYGAIFRKVIIMVSFITILTKCASHPNEINASYVSPLTFSEYECRELNVLMASLKPRSDALYVTQSAKSRADKWKMGIGMMLFWPALFALEGGDGLEAAEYARLKGEYEALRALSVQKRCNPYSDLLEEPIDTAPSVVSTRDASESPDKQLILKNLRENNVITEDDYEAALNPVNTSTLPDKLRELERLRNEGVLSENAYQSARSKTIIKFIDEQLE